MASVGYTRQSSFVDGDTINADLFNLEYNKLVNVFAYSSTGTTGHQHDGTAAEGGNIPQIGDQDFNNKIVVDSSNNRWGVFVEVSSNSVEQIRIQDGAIIPVTDSDVDLGTSSLYFKNAYIDSVTTTGNITIGGNLDVDGTLEFDSLSGTGTIAVTDILDQDDMSGNSATALATQQSIKAYVDAQQDTVDTFGEVLALSNTTAGTDIAVSTDDKVQFRDSAIYINSSADGQLDIVADTEIQIAATTIDINGAINASGNIVVSGTVDGRDVATDGTKLDGIEASADVTDTANVTAAGALMDSELTAIASVKALNQGVATGDSPTFVDVTATSLDISGDVDVDGTLEADAITINGTTLAETISDTVGAMVGSNTETGISVTYDDSDNTLDFVIGSGVITNAMLAGSIANSKLANSGITVTDGSTSTATALGGTITFAAGEGLDVGESSGTVTFSAEDATTSNKGVASFNSTDFSVSSGAVTLQAERIQDIVGGMVTSNTESGITVAYEDSDGTLDFTVGTLNQDTTGNAATATALETARTIHGVSFNGTANIDLTEVVQDTVGGMFSSNTETGITATYQDSDGTIDLVADVSSLSAPTITSPIIVGEIAIAPSEATTQTLTVTVASKTSEHPYDGGSGNAYVIDGVEAPYLTLVPDTTYRFDQANASNDGHPLRFYYESDKTTAYTSGVTTNGTPGNAGAYTEIKATASTPTALFYQCSSHALMGNRVNFDTRNLTGFATGDLVTSGSVTNAMLAGSIANAKLTNSSITIDGSAISLGGSVTTTNTMGSGFVLEDGDGTEVTITENKEVKFVEGGGIDINWTDTDNGTDADPYDLTFTIASGGVTNAMLAGSIANSKLSNSSITVSDGSNTTATALGGTITFSGTSSETTVAESSGTITIGLPNDVTVSNDLTVSGNLIVSGNSTITGSTISNTNFTGLSNNNSANSTDFGFYGKYVESSTTKYAGLFFDASTDNTFRLFTDTQTVPSTTVNTGATGYAAAKIIVGDLTATSLDISGDADIDGTLEADAITVNGTALNTVIAGVTVTNATNATNSTNATNATNSSHVLVTDNEDTNEENLITFVEGATSSTGNVGLEMDGHLTYNPSTGTVSATIFKGNIDAVDGDFDGTLEVDNLTIGGAQGTDGQVLTSTGSGVGWEDAGGGGGSMTLIATQTVSSSTASINFTSLGSFTRFRAIGSFEMSAGGYQGIKLYDNGSLISGSQYSSFRCTNYATPSTYNGAYGFITNAAIKNGFFIFDIAMVDGRPYVKMDVSGQEGDTHTGQKQDNTAGCLVDGYSLTSLTGFSFAPLGALSTATYTTAKVSLYGISTS